MKNYYQILNVRPTASEADIKRSYRVLAKRYHPDVNPGDAAAADKFADINEAHSVLSDPKTRAEYDAKLQESTATQLNPEDVIARQRAQAQAAARQAAKQAAYRNNMNATANANARREATMARVRQAAQAQAQAQAMRNAAQAQTQMQFQSAQFQAQVQALRNQAYRSGREQGVNEGKSISEAEITRLNASLRAATEENKRLKKRVDDESALKKQLIDAERDRRELEQELFNRDRELSQEKLRAKDIEDQLQALRAESGESIEEARKAKEECESLRGECKSLQKTLDKARLCIDKLEQDKKTLEQSLNQAELKNKSQIQLQQEKRRQMQEEIDELNRQLGSLTSEVDALRSENEQWQQYAKSEQFLSDAERKIDEWSKKTQADRRLAKPTLYGTLGVLIWATADEIEEAYGKLVKRYSGKTDETIVAKLEKVEEAHDILSDPEKRADYNMSIDISPERIADERRLIAENESLMEEYRNSLAGKEFWAHYDDINAAALAGDAVAQNTLGEMFYYGDEIERDLEQAVFWFKEAAKQKHPDAMFNLGICFVNGEGIEKNKTTGEGFIRQAVKLGSKPAQQYVASNPKKTSGGKRSSSKTVDRTEDKNGGGDQA